jgi:hypothetical protein
MTQEEILGDKTNGDTLYDIIYDYISANPEMTVFQIVGVLEQIKCEQIYYGIVKVDNSNSENKDEE